MQKSEVQHKSYIENSLRQSAIKANEFADMKHKYAKSQRRMSLQTRNTKLITDLFDKDYITQGSMIVKDNYLKKSVKKAGNKIKQQMEKRAYLEAEQKKIAKALGKKHTKAKMRVV